ncbi:MAG: ATP-binding protein [Pseudomonadota bacterium]
MKETPETVAVNLLHEILANRPPVREWIEEQLIRRRIPENQHLDYKGGKITSDKNSDGVRQAIAGMANAEGGVIVFGVNGGDAGEKEERWSVSACSPVGKLPADEWLKACLEPLRAFLHPQPVFHPLDDGEIVLVGVPRATNLVPCPGGRDGLIYYLRFYDQTLQTPPYLIADLVLGRRQRPRFQVQIEEPRVSSGRNRHFHVIGEDAVKPWWLLDFQLRIENAGMIWAGGLTCGVVAYSTADDREALPLTAPIEEAVYYHPYDGREVRYKRGPAMADLPPLDTTRSHPFSFSAWGLSAIEQKRRSVAQQWAEAEARGNGGWRSPGRGPGGGIRCTWLGALFITCRGYLPSWFQIEIEYNEIEQVIRTEAIEVATDRPMTGRHILVAKPGSRDEWISPDELYNLQYPTPSKS